MMPDPGSPWERSNPADGFGYLPFPVRSDEDELRWAECATAQVDTGPKGGDSLEAPALPGSAVPAGDAPHA
jgi:hypothetical protein